MKLNVYRKVFGYYRSSNNDSVRYFLEEGVIGFTETNYIRGKAALLGMLAVIVVVVGVSLIAGAIAAVSRVITKSNALSVALGTLTIP
ncbi:MAG: hypothetical protein EOO88_51200, partial [Pedobacter sp.]